MYTMSKSIQEIYSGWLTKSPPTKRIWRGVSARWRRRWFVLHQGELPAQYALSYFTDRNNHKQKGIIDLDQVDQIDVGFKFEGKKLKFDHMFAIKTPTRTYYLAAETENEMNSWVENICNICKMRTSDDEECNMEPQQSLVVAHAIDSPPISPVSTSPYIPISECITGKTPILPSQPLNDFNMIQHVQSTYYRKRNIDDAPTYLNFGSFPVQGNNRQEPDYCNFGANISPLQSPTDSESVFTDDDWPHNSSQSGEHSFRNLRPSSSSAEVDTSSIKKTNSVLAPPRPPKPQHINTTPNLYLNLQTSTNPAPKGSRQGSHSKSSSICEENPAPLTDESYDFPRSHVGDALNAETRNTLGKRHVYNNAAPSEGLIFTYDNPHPSPKAGTSKIFRYGDELVGDEPASPLSQSSAQFSNQPSPHIQPVNSMPPPQVDRGLKPRRKLSDSVSITSSNEPNSPRLAMSSAPSVDRKLKPSLTLPTTNALESDDDNSSVKKCRAAPSPIPNGQSIENVHSESHEQIYHYFGSLEDQRKKLEYLDLDLDLKSNENPKQRTRSSFNEDTSPRSPGAITVYKKVDFFKTEAFNITRNNLEEERKKEPFKK